jgi:hypothetical protein
MEDGGDGIFLLDGTFFEMGDKFVKVSLVEVEEVGVSGFEFELEGGG